MTTLVIATGYNSPPRNPRDAECVFMPESRAFRELHGGSYLEIVSPVPAAIRRQETEHHIRACSGLDVLAVFGHGHVSGLGCTGHSLETKRSPSTLAGLAAAIRAATTPPDTEIDIILYACLTGRGTTGFADALADALPWAHVYAHSTAGHATWNPYVELSGGPNGGDPIFTPKDGPRWARWRDRLRDEQVFRLTFWHPGRGLPRAAAIEAIREEAVK